MASSMDCALEASADCVRVVDDVAHRRDGDGRDNGEHRDDDDQFDEGEAFFALRFFPEGLFHVHSMISLF
jgi:hypothetical protein